MKLRTLIVDDEMLARDRLRKLLMQEPGVDIIGECASGSEAVECLNQERPELVFLDVQMPQFSGLEVARALPAGYLPVIVFVTAHDRYAVDAFEVQALDYLLKPFSKERLQTALQRARWRLQTPLPARTDPFSGGARMTEKDAPRLNRFAVKDGNQMLFVKAQDVDYIEAAANYVVLCTPKGNHVIRETLRNLEAALSSMLFVRISRSLIVNVHRIKAIQSGSMGEWLVILQDNRELLMTRGLKEVQERLQYSWLPLSTEDI